MERIVYRISLDATKSGIQGTLQGFMTGDILSRRIEITLAYRGESVALTESETAVMYIHKTGAETPSINSCTIDGDKVIYDVLQSDVDTAGITKMQLKIVSGEQILMSPYFAIEVTDSMTGDTQAVTTPTYSALETALAQAQTVYNSRLISVELGEDLIFTATYADGTVYTSDAIANEIGGVSEAEAARIIAEENRVLAESVRADEFATLKSNVQGALDVTVELHNEVNSLIDSNVVTTEDRQKWDGKADGLSYVGSKLSLLNGNEVLKTVEIIGGGGEVIIPDKVLTATNVTATEAITPVLNAELFGSRSPEAYALKEELTARSLPIMSLGSQSELLNFLNNYSAAFADGTFYELEVNGVEGYELNEGVWYISGTKRDSLNETQNAKRYCPDRVEIKRRSKYEGVWTEWVADVNALDLTNITNGTTQVGNAKTLDGHGAEYFASVESETLTTSILDKALTLTQGTYEFDLGGSSYTGTDLPSSNYKYGKATVRTKGKSSAITVILWGVLASGNVIPPVFNLYNGGVWSNWQTLATTADLAKYLPLTGGTLSGNLLLRKTTAETSAILSGNANGEISLRVEANGTRGLFDNTTSDYLLYNDGTNKVFKGTASGNLPLSGGGTIKSTSNVPVVFNTTNSNPNVLRFQRNGANLGHIGFVGVDEPTFINGAGDKVKYLLHTGNKPTGTYTGNGDANWRAIDTGGAIGEAVVIVSEKGAGIVTAKGVIGKDSNTNIIGISSADCFYDSTNHRIAIMSANDILNASGVTYRWSVL